MGKKNKMDLVQVFSQALFFSKGNPEICAALLNYFVHAAQPDAPPSGRAGRSDDQHTAKARLLTRNYR